MELRTWWAHWKLRWIKSEKQFMKILETKKIPCIRCNQPFKSHIHYGDWCYVYDNTCKNCLEAEK